MEDDEFDILVEFLEAEFHQDVEDPDIALKEFINDADRDYLDLLSRKIETFLISELSEYEKEKFITTHTYIYYPAIGLKPIEWMKMVLCRIKKSLKASYTKWNCQYHIIFLPQYHKEIIYGNLRKDMKEILKILCQCKKVEIVKVSVFSDHIHLCLNIPPDISVSEFVRYLKRESVLMMYNKYPNIVENLKGDFWSNGYYVTTFGNTNEEAMRKYIIDYWKR